MNQREYHSPEYNLVDIILYSFSFYGFPLNEFLPYKVFNEIVST
jgi:hypothetical protein